MIQSVKKAMDILTVLSATPEVPIPLGELAERTNINKSTCAHIVDTLCESFYVEARPSLGQTDGRKFPKI